MVMDMDIMGSNRWRTRAAFLLFVVVAFCCQGICTFSLYANSLRSQSLEAHLRKYEALHKRVLAHPTVSDKFVVVHTNTAGWGNNLPSMVTGFFLALYLERVMFIDGEKYFAEFQHVLDFNWAHEDKRLWQQLASQMLNKTQNNVTFSASRKPVGGRNSASYLMNTHFKSEFQNITILDYTSEDYEMPYLQANTDMLHFLNANFPTGEVFWPLAQYLFTLSEANEEVVAGFSKAHFRQYNVGLQIRRQRHMGGWGDPVPLETYCSLALLLKQRSGLDDNSVGFFLATDTPHEVLPALKACVGEKNFFFVKSYNAIQDMKLLSLCDEVIVTFTSTFGTVASAWGGMPPIHTTYGPHNDGTRPWFWKAVTTEPCSWYSQLFLSGGASAEDKQKFKSNPDWMQVAQCYTAYEESFG